VDVTDDWLTTSSTASEVIGGPEVEDTGGLQEHAGRLAAQGRYDEAELLLRRVISTWEAVDGPLSLQVAVSCHELAGILAARDDVDEAARLYERALTIKRRVLGDRDPDLVTTLHDLALLREATGRPDEARDLWAEASALIEPEGEP
jgi:tetratricopeptide (TPR) repeat protein